MDAPPASARTKLLCRACCSRLVTQPAAPVRLCAPAPLLQAPFGLPASYSLLLGDVCGGSETPGMVRDVMKWKKAAADAAMTVDAAADGALAPFAALLEVPPAAGSSIASSGTGAPTTRAAAVVAAMAAAGGPQLWRQCAGATALLEEVLRELRAAMKADDTSSSSSSSSCGGVEAVGRLEHDARSAFALSRRLFRCVRCVCTARERAVRIARERAVRICVCVLEGSAADRSCPRPLSLPSPRHLQLCSDMGVAAGVPLEPTSQTALVDSILATDPAQVVAAGVPGAGGFDAVFAICTRLGASIDGLFGGVAPAAVTPCLCSCGPPVGAPGAGLRLEGAALV